MSLPLCQAKMAVRPAPRQDSYIKINLRMSACYGMHAHAVLPFSQYGKPYATEERMILWLHRQADWAAK